MIYDNMVYLTMGTGDIMKKIGIIADTHNLLRKEVKEILKTVIVFFMPGISADRKFWRNWLDSHRCMRCGKIMICQEI